MAKRNVARTLVHLVVFGATAYLFAGWTAHSMKLTRDSERAADHAAAPREFQLSNQEAKGDRLIVLARLPVSSAADGIASLAAIIPEREPDAVPAPAAAAPTPPAGPPLVLLPPPPKVPKRPSWLLDDHQIASIKGRLRLTSAQAQYWPAVEQALREVGRMQMRRPQSGQARIDVNSPEVQQLVFAAMPLLMQLREDQKREVRSLVRVIGLEQVAAQI